MANIQSGINQFISQAAILSRLAPGFEERQEAYKLSKEEEALRKEHTQSLEGLRESNIGEQEFEQMEKTGERIVNLRERQFQNRPTKESYEKMLKAEDSVKRAKEVYSQLQNRRAQDRAAQQVKQKMDFDDFKKQLTVKDLPQNLQEKAYNEYTTSKK